MNRKIENCRDFNGCIDLSKLEGYKEKGEVVNGSYTKAWYNVDGTRFLHKQYSSILLAFGEVLYSKVAKSIGVNCASYDFAELYGEPGVITYDFLKKDEAYYTTLELTSEFTDSKFSLAEIQKNKDLLAMHNSKYNNLKSIKELLENLFHISDDEKKQIQIELVKMFCLDALFLHSDRNLWNHGVIVDELTDKMRLAPIHDNSHVLRLENGKEYIKNAISRLISNEKIEDFENSSTFNVVDGCENLLDQLIRFYVEADDDVRAIIEDIYYNVNVQKCVEEVNNVCKIDDVSLLWIKAMLNYRQNSILKVIESVKISDDEAKMPNISLNKRK